MDNTAIIFNRHIDPMAKHSEMAISISHANAEYVQGTNMPTKLDRYATYDKYFVDLNGRYVHIYTTYKVTAINCAKGSTVHIFTIYYWADVATALQI